MAYNLVNALKDVKSNQIEKHVRVVNQSLIIKEDNLDFISYIYNKELKSLGYRNINRELALDRILNLTGKEIYYLLDTDLLWTGYILSGDRILI